MCDHDKEQSFHVKPSRFDHVQDKHFGSSGSTDGQVPTCSISNPVSSPLAKLSVLVGALPAVCAEATCLKTQCSRNQGEAGTLREMKISVFLGVLCVVVEATYPTLDIS